jgi:hypothetical protein
MSPEQPLSKSTVTQRAPASDTVGELTPAAEFVHSYGSRALDLFAKWYGIIRRPFYNRIAWIGLLGGLLLASGSFWPDLFMKFAGEFLKNNFPVAYTSFKAEWDQYEPKIDLLGTVCGTIIVVVALAYHWLSSKYDQAQRVLRYRETMERLDADRASDAGVLDRFSQKFSDQDFNASIASLMQGKSSPSITRLNARYDFWRDPAIGFRASELDARKNALCAAHKSLNDAVKRSSSQDDVLAALRELAGAHAALLGGIGDVYRAKLTEAQKIWRVG